MAVIECNDVGIRYLTGDLKSIGLKDYVIRKLTGRYKVSDFWADRHISFSIDKGDMLGIIGSNGAGKSTLLKAITGILLPREGNIIVNGKIAALLELTSGFDEEMSVRENVFLRGAMLGYKEQFIKDTYDSIIDFAELQDFQDYALKQLSSGMKSRLAFSIACLVEPDILILDEVLSVGDGAFRKKSGDRMKQILESGITGILVSHSIDQVRELCNKVLWIERGQQIAFSDQVDVCCNAYEEFLKTKNLPKSFAEIEMLSDSFVRGRIKEREDKARRETERLEQLLNEGKKDTAIQAAVNILKRNRPDYLSSSILIHEQTDQD